MRHENTMVADGPAHTGRRFADALHAGPQGGPTGGEPTGMREHATVLGSISL